ncbi:MULTISPECIES: adenylosuccinate lyase [unclassified Campylobacter]|uniref:adenylosuccinate lyase n=1 Tax=unclassified Campylobacter TaxID=2593542 RepID=UPI001D68E053|nr:adenylosuccinate lyase [Campylobacter sp. RM9331]MBZ8006437.1 adenylosuccinate lyase [Campylobacter sp. RM9332]
MIARYSNPEMSSIWSEEAKFNAWLEVELATCKAFNKIGVIPNEDLEKLYKNAKFDIAKIKEIEEQTKHDVIAFTRALSLNLGDERKWVHYGLTSTDVVDTAQAIQLKKANEIIKANLENLLGILKEKANLYKYTPQIGRTHGVHAELTTTGLKFAYFYEEIKRNYERFINASEEIRVGKISGAVGTYANVPLEVELDICKELGLNVANISTQVLPRDLHANYISVCALIASALERFATEIRHLAKTECVEMLEYFSENQKGSSAMPHKKNPIGSENICGLSRVIRGYLITAYENINLWHERDISHSSAERIMLPDVTILLDYMLKRFSSIVKNLMIYPENMKSNLDKSYGLIFSQQVLLALIQKGLSREMAYDLVQGLTKKAWSEKLQFKELLKNSKEICEILSTEEIENAFLVDYHLKNIDKIYERLGL